MGQENRLPLFLSIYVTNYPTLHTHTHGQTGAYRSIPHYPKRLISIHETSGGLSLIHTHTHTHTCTPAHMATHTRAHHGGLAHSNYLLVFMEKPD